MSAYIVSDRHINTLASWAEFHKVYCCGGNVQAEMAAALLYAANVESVNYRYKEGTETLYSGFEPQPPDRHTPIEIARLCDSLEYQSCEHPGYEASQAAKLLAAIKFKAVTLLPGYATAPRSID
jgi:hypothetical protein